MAIKGGFRFPVRFEDAFPMGVVMGADGVQRVTDFEKKGKGDDQSRDKQAPDLREWAVRVHDLDEDLEGKAREVVIKISAPVQPTPPAGAFQQIEFANLTVTPWLEEKVIKGRLTKVLRFSYRATGFKDARAAANSNGSGAAPKTLKAV